MQDDALPDDLASIWERVLKRLRSELPASTFRLWIEPLRPLCVRNTTLHLAAPDASRAWIERRYSGSVESALRSLGCGLQRVVVVQEATHRPPANDWTTLVESLPLDPHHTFERFVIGDANRLAHAAALAVAELPGEAYNPLFLHGPPGLGKTHLLGAIVDYLRRRRPDLTVHYTTAERFTTEFVGALRNDGPEGFKQRYRQLDALLIDDVQALEGKDRTQEEFVHTFNALHAVGKQIVLSSDRPPDALARLAERLRDRFQWGLCTELGVPDMRTRTALLWRMTLDAPLELPEPTVLREIAALAAGNVRRLEGAMTRIAALSSVLDKPVTSALVRQALTRSTPPHTESPGPVAGADSPSVTAIQEAVCSVLGVSRRDLLSPMRTARIARARQLAVYLARELTPLSLAQIAREFNRDHTTVLHSIRAVSGRLGPHSETSTVLHRARQLLDPGANLDPPRFASVNRPSPSPPRPSTDRGRQVAP